MGISTDFLKSLGIEDKEIIDKIFAERGKEVNETNSKIAELEKAIQQKENDFKALNKSFDELKNNNASADEWKEKYEKIVEETKEKERLAKEEAKEQKRNADIQARFSAVVGDKKFSHSAIEKDYLSKFKAALDDKENVGKSDSDIFAALTKDDETAFVGVQQLKFGNKNPLLAGNGKKFENKNDIYQIKDPIERQRAIANNLDLFEEGE